MGKQKGKRRPAKAESLPKPRRTKSKRQMPLDSPKIIAKANVAQSRSLECLQGVNRRCQKSTTVGGPDIVTVIDNGAMQCLVGNKGWRILVRHPEHVSCEGAFPGSTPEILQIVDAATTLLDERGRGIAIARVNQGMHCPSSEQTLLAEDQLENNGIEVYSRAKAFGGKQCLLVKHPVTAKSMKIQLGWEHSTKFLHTRMPTKRELKELPVIELTSQSPYDPSSPLASQKTRRMVTHHHRAFQWS